GRNRLRACTVRAGSAAKAVAGGSGIGLPPFSGRRFADVGARRVRRSRGGPKPAWVGIAATLRGGSRAYLAAPVSTARLAPARYPGNARLVTIRHGIGAKSI